MSIAAFNEEYKSKDLQPEVIHDVAETFSGKDYAFAAVHIDGTSEYGLGIAVRGERGYSPIPHYHAHYATYVDADTAAEKLNTEALSLDSKEAMLIVLSTMKIND